MGPVTHMTKVRMDISSHRELATFQVANLQNHEVIHGMPWLREHNPTPIGTTKGSHSTVNDVRLGVSNVHLLHMPYPKKKPWKRISSSDSPRSRLRMARRPMTRASELRRYLQRPECLRRDQQEPQDMTCTQVKEPTFLPEGKQLLGQG